MKRFFLISGCLLLAACLAGYVTLQFFMGSIVKSGFNRFAPNITQSSATLAAAQISPLSGKGTLSGLAVGNPKGWSGGNAFYLGKIDIDLEPFSIFGDHVVINEITIENPEFNYETKVIASNIGDLLKNIETATGSKDPGTKPTAKTGNPIKFEVKKLVLRGAKVSVGAVGAAVTVPMPPITLENLGTGNGGITADQLAFAVMRSVTTGIVSATAGAALKIGATGGATAAEGVKKVGEAIKGIFTPAPAAAPAKK